MISLAAVVFAVGIAFLLTFPKTFLGRPQTFTGP
jgi:hypothetical protein